MNCHYSCVTCTAPFYFDLCVTCPASRTITASICPCSSGFYQQQAAQCTSEDLINGLDSTLITIANYAYYASVFIHLFFIILMINRIISLKLKKIVDTLQVLSIINYYRYVQHEVSSKSLKAIQAFNFQYFSNFVCQKTKPPLGCNVFENLFGVGFTLIAFFLLTLVSYFISVCIYNGQSKDENVIYIKNGKERTKENDDTLDFLIFWATLSSSIMLLYLDQTAIQTTLAICRIAIVNYYGLIAAIPFIFLIILVVRKHFTTINSSNQTTFAYRAQHSYFYIYDQQYHLYYIDHLFEDDNIGKDTDHVRNPYYPQSNLIIMETLFKILVAVSAIVFYQYSPNLFVYCCLFLLLVSSCLLKVFWTYQIFDLWFHYIMVGVQAFAFGVFYTSSFFKYFIVFTVLSLQLLAVMIIITSISAWKRDKEGEIFVKIFKLAKQNRAKVSNLNDSQEGLNKSQKKSVEQLASKMQSSQMESINPDPEQENKQLKKRIQTIYPDNLQQNNQVKKRIQRQYSAEPAQPLPKTQKGKFSQPNLTQRQSIPTIKDANISYNFQPTDSIAQPPSVNNRVTSRKTNRSYSIANKLSIGNKGQGVKSLDTIQQKKPQDNIANNTGSKNIFQP